MWENDQVVAAEICSNFLVSPYPSPDNPVPSPKNEPLNDDPDIAVAFVKSTTDPDTNNDPVIIAEPLNGNPEPAPAFKA